MNEKQIKISSDTKKQLLPDEYIIYSYKPKWWDVCGVPISFSIIFLLICFFVDKLDEKIMILIPVVVFTCFMWVMAIFSYIKEDLVLTNKRVITGPFSESNIEINLNDIERVFQFIGVPGCFQTTDITFVCKNKKNIELRVVHMRLKDYEKFKKLLTEECKKHGNNIS